ncbi:hypothetical protein BMW23_0413 [Bodo saltans virus]|uniref:Uncharacterized protein n=1 Tax=Bodo saltans virus TaxID=2024608 RepID=A0A2H4UUC3_9VIRU|nr:hypothetical protein QJ851_gp0403 [Bodo saltans virus]ATZ80466.1 hypothetical protein BMW23_0413 [Bodo saltans virus]
MRSFLNSVSWSNYQNHPTQTYNNSGSKNPYYKYYKDSLKIKLYPTYKSKYEYSDFDNLNDYYY